MSPEFNKVLRLLLTLLLLGLLPACTSDMRRTFLAGPLGKTLIADPIHNHRMAEVESTSDQTLLMKMVTNSTDYRVQLAAVNKITDQSLLLNIVTNKTITNSYPQKDCNLHLAAAKRLSDQETLFNLLSATNAFTPKTKSLIEIKKTLRTNLTNQVLLARLSLIGAEPTPEQRADFLARASSAPEWPRVYPPIPSVATPQSELNIDEIQNVSCPGTLALVLNSPVHHELVNIDSEGLAAGFPGFLTGEEETKIMAAAKAGKIVLIQNPGLLANSEHYSLKKREVISKARTLGFGEASRGNYGFFNFNNAGTPTPKETALAMEKQRLDSFLAMIKDQSRGDRLQAVVSLTNRDLLAGIAHPQFRRYFPSATNTAHFGEIARLRLFLLEPMIQNRIGITDVTIHHSPQSQVYVRAITQSNETGETILVPVSDSKKTTNYGEAITTTLGGGHPDNQLQQKWITVFPENTRSPTIYDWSKEYWEAKVDVSSLIALIWSRFTENERAQIALTASIRNKHFGINAVNSLTDPALLKQVAAEARNGEVRAAAQDRLKAVRKPILNTEDPSASAP